MPVELTESAKRTRHKALAEGKLEPRKFKSDTKTKKESVITQLEKKIETNRSALDRARKEML